MFAPSGRNVDGLTGRSKVRTIVLAIGEPSAARLVLTVSPGSPTGPCVLAMTRGPAAKVSCADSMSSPTLKLRVLLPSFRFDDQTGTMCPLSTARPWRWPKPVATDPALPDDSLSGTGPRLTVLPVMALTTGAE